MTIAYIEQNVDPAKGKVRPFHYRTLQAAGAVFASANGMLGPIVDRYGEGVEAETARARALGIADLSALPRTGFKGRNALDWLGKQGVTVPAENNRSAQQPGGGFVARLANSEAVVLGSLGLGDGLVDKLNGSWSMETADGCYQVPRQGTSFWFAVTGTEIGAMFAKICGVDLRASAFGDGAIAQTSVARTNCIIIRHDLGSVPAFHVLGDSASADYMWGCLLDAMAEFAGAPVGFSAVSGLLR